MGMTQRTLVVDGNNILMRSVKAAENRVHLSVDLDGREVNTGPLTLFIGLLTKYLRQEGPDRVVVCWDGGRSAHRTAIYPNYKAAREERREEKDYTPFALAKEFLTLAGIHHVEITDVEADDLVAAYWHRKHNEERLIIVSGDKDFLQLLDGWTEQIRPGAPTSDAERWTRNRVRTEMGCLPEHLPLTMALAGDAGDGVPGVPGIGHKTACKFLAKHDWSLDALLDARPQHPKLEGYGDYVRRNLALVDLTRPIPGVEVAEPPKFVPTEPGSLLYGNLTEWLKRLRMEATLDRLATRALWR